MPPLLPLLLCIWWFNPYLRLISIEIVTEAIERLVVGAQMKRIGELLTVSTLGLGVNLVGIMAFDHAHHGHGHSHGSHKHDHGHGHEHQEHHHNHGHESPPQAQSHDHKHEHQHEHDCHDPSSNLHLSNSHQPENHHHSQGHHHHHHHSHGNDNMRGIFLHILADTLGSVAVVISSILIHFYSWPGFDPLASCLIAILIFASAIPLVMSSAKTLLLTIPADTEYLLRETLADVSSLRGVVGYSVPRFWLDDGDGAMPGSGVLGVIHVVAMRGVENEEVRARVSEFLNGRGVDAVVHVEKEGEGRCWCGGGAGAVTRTT